MSRNSGSAEVHRGLVAGARAVPEDGLVNGLLTTEVLMDVFYGIMFEEPHPAAELFKPICDMAGQIGASIPVSVIAAAKDASRKGFVGIDRCLGNGGTGQDIDVQVSWNSPTVYIRLRCRDAFVVLRVEGNPKRKNTREACIHEISSGVEIAGAMLTALGGSWEMLAKAKQMGASRRFLVNGAIASSRTSRSGSRAVA